MRDFAYPRRDMRTDQGQGDRLHITPRHAIHS